MCTLRLPHVLSFIHGFLLPAGEDVITGGARLQRRQFFFLSLWPPGIHRGSSKTFMFVLKTSKLRRRNIQSVKVANSPSTNVQEAHICTSGPFSRALSIAMHELELVLHNIFVVRLPHIFFSICLVCIGFAVSIGENEKMVLSSCRNIKIGGCFASNACFWAPKCFFFLCPWLSANFSRRSFHTSVQATDESPHTPAHSVDSTLHTPHFTFHTPPYPHVHFPVHSFHPKLNLQHSTLHLTRHILHFITLSTLPHSTPYNPHTTFYNSHPTLYN